MENDLAVIFSSPGIERADSSEDELDESTVPEEGEEQKGKKNMEPLHMQASEKEMFYYWV